MVSIDGRQVDGAFFCAADDQLALETRCGFATRAACERCALAAARPGARLGFAALTLAHVSARGFFVVERMVCRLLSVFFFEPMERVLESHRDTRVVLSRVV